MNEMNEWVFMVYFSQYVYKWYMIYSNHPSDILVDSLVWWWNDVVLYCVFLWKQYRYFWEAILVLILINCKFNIAILEILKKSQNDSESLGKRNRFQGYTMSSLWFIILESLVREDESEVVELCRCFADSEGTLSNYSPVLDPLRIVYGCVLSVGK